LADDSEPTPPGWYRQPEDPDLLRWWDGEDWTDDTMPVPRRRTRRDAMAVAEAAAASGDLRPLPEPDEGPPTEAIALVLGEDPLPELRPRRHPEPEIPAEPEANAPRPRPRAKRPAVRAPQAAERPRERPRQPELEPLEILDDGDGGSAEPVRRRRIPAPDGSPGYRRPPEEAYRAQRAGRPAAPRPTGQRPGERPRHLDEERRGTRLAAPISPATARSAMKIAVRAGLIAVLVAIAWFGYVKVRDASPSDAATLSKDPTPVTVDKQAPRLDQIVLTLSDLPRGWEAQATDPSSDDICDGRIPRSVIEPTSIKSAAFTKGDTGALIGNVVQEFTDDSAAEAFMDLTARVVDSCREYSTDQASVRLSPMSFPTFGDQTFVAEASGDAPGGALHGAIVYLRSGNRVSSVITITFGDSGVNTELIEHLADVVNRRMNSKPAIDQPIQGDDGGGGGTGATLPGDS
jgi:hypothetical protein